MGWFGLGSLGVLGGFFGFFPLLFCKLSCSPVLRGLCHDAGWEVVVPGRGVVVPTGPWEPSAFPGAWKIAFLAKMTAANPVSIFSGGVVSRWRGMLPARLLPAPLLLPLLAESLLSFRSVQVTNCLHLPGFFFPPTSCRSDAAALFHHRQPPPCLGFPIHACQGRDALGWIGQWGVWGGTLPRATLQGGEGLLLGAPSSAPKTSIFYTSPGAASALQPPCAPLPASRGWHPHVPHVCYTHGCCLLACQPLPSCANTPPHPPRHLPALTQWHPEMTAPRCRQESPMAHPPPQRLCPSQLLPVSWDAPSKARIRRGPHGWDGAGGGGMRPVEPATHCGELSQPSPAVS